MIYKSKIFLIVFLTIILLVSLTNYCLAANKKVDYVNMTEQARNAFGHEDGDADESARNVVGAIIVFVRVIGVGVTIIMLTVLAIKYMTSAPSDKAEIKKHAIIYIIGVLLFFSAIEIVSLIRQFVIKNFKVS